MHIPEPQVTVATSRMDERLCRGHNGRLATQAQEDHVLEDRLDNWSVLGRPPRTVGGRMKVGDLYMYGNAVVVITNQEPMWRNWIPVLSLSTGFSFQVQSHELRPIEQPDKKCP